MEQLDPQMKKQIRVPKSEKKGSSKRVTRREAQNQNRRKVALTEYQTS
jgi:hypothetical protein